MPDLRDPVHFFDAMGISVLKNEHLERENARLTAENERLRRLLAAQAREIRALKDERFSASQS